MNHPLRYVPSTRRLLLAFTGLCSVAIAACNRAEASGENTRTQKRDDSAIVVAVGTESFSLADVEAPIAHQLFELRSAAAQDLILSALVKSEAEKQKLSVHELLRREVDQKLTPPSQSELERAYAEEKEHDSAGKLPSFEEVKPRLVDQLQGAGKQVRQQQFASELLNRADLRMNLDALGRPKHKTRAGGPSRGPANARIQIVEYTDFTSRFCALAQPTVERLFESYPKDVRFEFRQAPEPGNALAEAAAQAALCADEQERYWDYRKRLFSEQSKLSFVHLRMLAAQLGLDVPRFERCLAEGDKAAVVASDRAEATSQNLEGSPVFSVNGARLSGAHPYETFARLVRLDLSAPAPKR